MSSYYKGRLAWVRWEWEDYFTPTYWTAVTVSVFGPSYEMPRVVVMVNISNGGGSSKFRCKSVKEAQERVVIPEKYLERLYNAESHAWQQLESIRYDLANLDRIKAGAKVVDLNTGEILNEAERILEGDK